MHGNLEVPIHFREDGMSRESHHASYSLLTGTLRKFLAHDACQCTRECNPNGRTALKLQPL